MRLALVVAIHPERHTVDLVYQDTGLRVAEAAIVGSLVSSDHGEWNVPSVPKPSAEKSAGSLPTSGRQLVAVADEVSGRPVVVGFIHPLGGQLTFTEQDRQVSRHSSGAYSTTAPDGSIELWHPSGSFVRIGTGSHQPLASISADKNWQEISTAAAPTITVHTAKFDLSVDPSGNVTVHAQGTGSLAFDGTLAITSKGAMSIHSDVSVAINAPQINLN